MGLALVALQRLGHVPNAETRKWGLTGKLSNQYAFILQSVMYLGCVFHDSSVAVTCCGR